jgi:hypothetical protein
MNHSWICRPYRPGDEDGIRHLYRDVFHLEMSPQLWQWMYELNPAGAAVIIVLEHQGRLAGHYAVQPREFWLGGNRCTVGFAVGTMLRTEIRSIGALAEMAQQAYQMCRQRHYPWLYAFPNDQAHRVRCALLGWHALPEITEWDGPLPRFSSDVAGDVRTWRTMPDTLNFEPVVSAPAGGSTCNANRISPARAQEWLQWRYFDRPDSEYVLHTVVDQQAVNAYAVTKRYTRDGMRYGHVLDWRVTPDGGDPMARLLASVWSQLAEWEVQRVSCWARGQTVFSDYLAQAGLTMTGNKTNFCYLDLDDRLSEVLSQPDAWQVEMADSDRY